jgi:fibronectin-binding autotransporter adhesin
MLVLGQIVQYYGGLFDLNGGTLEANASFTTNFPLALGTPAGNATIDPAGYTIRLSGRLSGRGNLIETDGGTLILSGTNTYTGGTTVSGGTLIVASREGLADGSSLFVGNVAAFASIVPADAPPIGSSPASVSEPGTFALFAIAIGWIACRRRRNWRLT